MTKGRKRLVTDDRQLSIWDAIQRERELRESTRPGRLNIKAQLVAAMKEAIRKAPKSREVIAEEMTEMLGERVTESSINNWTADSHPHEISAAKLAAFCQSTGDMEPVRIVAETSGVFTLPGPDALRAEIEKDREREKEIKEGRRRKEVILRELEGKKG